MLHKEGLELIEDIRLNASLAAAQHMKMVTRFKEKCAAYGLEPPPAFVAALASSNHPQHLQLTDGGAASQEPHDPLDNVRSLLRDVYTARQELTSRPLFEGDAPELRLSVREFVVDVAVVRLASAQAPQVVQWW